MPKDSVSSVVHDTLNQPIPGNPDAARAVPIASPLQVTVGWTPAKAPYPQVRVSTHAADNATAVRLVDQQRRAGLDVLLDRDGINRLIRALRKARDAAYGSDA